MKKKFFNLKLTFLLLFSSAYAQESHQHSLFPYQAPKNFDLFINEGRVHHPVTTNNPEAQQFFDQGLTLIYAFNHDAAYWSFQKASQLDPQLAMAYWGMALSLGQNINIDIDDERERIANNLIKKALALAEASNITDSEKAYIDALNQRYSDNPKSNRTELAKNYYAAMQKLTERFPDDLDGATLFAESGLDLNPWGQWDDKGNPKPGTLEIVAVLENVLKWDPKHLGANHYYIHAIEASNYPERALMSAERLRNMLPNAGHILHMPGHIFLLVGDYHLAAECNVKAIEADKKYIREFGMDGVYPLHYLSHNLYFLSRSYSMEGRPEDAKRAAEELYQLFVPSFKKMPELEYYAPTSLFVLLRFNKWKEILEQPLLPQEMKMAKSLEHFVRAMAYASLNEIADAKKEQNLFLETSKQLPADAKFGNNKTGPIMSIARLVLQAKLAEINKDAKSAIESLQQAIQIQDQLGYNEPPDWSIPVRESLGDLLLSEKKYKEAEAVYRTDLEKHPRSGRSLFGLMLGLQGQNRHSDAFWIKREFDEAWKYSTVPLP